MKIAIRFHRGKALLAVTIRGTAPRGGLRRHHAGMTQPFINTPCGPGLRVTSPSLITPPPTPPRPSRGSRPYTCRDPVGIRGPVRIGQVIRI